MDQISIVKSVRNILTAEKVVIKMATEAGKCSFCSTCDKCESNRECHLYSTICGNLVGLLIKEEFNSERMYNEINTQLTLYRTGIEPVLWD